MNGNLDFLLELLRRGQQPQQQNGYLAQVLPQAMPDQGYPSPSAPSNPYASQQQIDNSGRVIDPFKRGQYYGQVFDPSNQMGGHEANILGRYRYQDL